MDRNPDYSFHRLEEQSLNIVDGLLIKYGMTAKDMALRGKGTKNVVIYIYCKELMRGLLQNTDQSRSMSNLNSLFSL